MIFIVGVGRSGTSLLQNMLHGHPKIVFLPETSMLRRLIFSGLLERRYKQGGVETVFQALKTDSSLHRLKIDDCTLINILKKSLESRPFGIELYCTLRDYYIENNAPGVSLIGDKDPRLIESLWLLKSYFPESYIVHIYRDPPDVLLSKKKADWSKNRPPYLNAAAF